MEIRICEEIEENTQLGDCWASQETDFYPQHLRRDPARAQVLPVNDDINEAWAGEYPSQHYEIDEDFEAPRKARKLSEASGKAQPLRQKAKLGKSGKKKNSKNKDDLANDIENTLKSLRVYRETQEKLIEDNTSLSENEKKRLKQIIRNRISARESRDKNKLYIQQLEQENSDLKEEFELLRTQIQEVSKQNQYMKQELSSIHSRIAPGKAGFVLASIGLLAVFCLVSTFASGSAPPHESRVLAVQSSEITHFGAGAPEPLSIEPVSMGSPCFSEPERSTTSKFYCPEIQSFFDETSSKISHFQLIVPYASLRPGKIEAGSNDWAEVICSVLSQRVFPLF